MMRNVYAFTTLLDMMINPNFARIKIGDTHHSGNKRTKQQQTGISSKQIIINPKRDRLYRSTGKMRFDLVLGNPPFQKRGWKNFLEKMSQVSADYVCIICPDPTKNDSSFGSEIRKILLDAGVYQKQECTNYFPGIESGEISYFLCSKNNKVEFLFEEDAIYISIRNKVSPNGSFVLRGSQNSITAETSLLPDNEYRFLGIFSASKTGLDMRYMKDVDYEISKKHREKLNGPFFIINRFFGKNVDDPVFLIDEIRDIFIGSNVMVIKSSNGDTVEGFQSVYGSKIYRF